MRKYTVYELKKGISGIILTLIICMAMIFIGLHGQLASVKANDVPPLPTLTVVPSEVEAYPGETFDVNITINDLAAEWELAGYDVYLHYGTGLLNVTDVVLGEFFEDFKGPDGIFNITEYGDWYYPPNSTYDDEGVALTTRAFINGFTTPYGSGTLATITFQWNATEWDEKLLAGCDLTIEAKLADRNATEIPYKAIDGYFKPKAGPVLKVYPSEVEAYPGETFDVNITINDLAAEWELAGYEVRLHYGTGLLGVIGVVACEFFEDFEGPDGTFNITKFGDDYYPPSSTYDDEGEAMAVCTFIDGFTPPYGSGTLATITFQWDAPRWDETLLAGCDLVIEVKLSDSNTNPIPYTKVDGHFKPKAGPVLTVVPPSEVIVAPGGTVDVNITINDLPAEWDLYGWEFQLWYDTDVLDVVNVVEGPFMESFAGSDGTYFEVYFDGDWLGPHPDWTYEKAGLVAAVCTLLDGAATPSGSGTLATITFEFNVTGGSALNLEIPDWPFPAKLSDSETNPIPCTAVHSAVPEMPVLMVVPSLVTVALGQTFDVDITINDLRVEWYLAGFEVRIHYDTAVLDVIDVVVGPFLQSFAGPDGTFNITKFGDDYYPPNSTYDDEGVALATCAFVDGFTPPNGTGVLATISFNLTESGESVLKFEVPDWPYPAKLSDIVTNPIPCAAVSGHVTVSTEPDFPDLNDDGLVDIFDGVIMAIAYGTKPGDPKWNSRADVNHDNIIDIYDLIIWASHYGETTP